MEIFRTSAVALAEPARPPTAAPARAESTFTENLAPPRLRWDAGLVFLVLLLAFFLGSFPVRNSAFWLHLGTGKAYFSGQAQFGAEPFTTAGDYWVNPSWLFDVLLYVFYPEVVGGAGLVLFKALLVVLLAASLVYAGRVGKSLWVAALSSALTLVAIGPWLDLTPLLASILLFSLTIGIIEKAPWTAKTGEPVRWLYFIPILLVTVLWVNLDQWFILAPLTVAIYWLGTMLPATGRGQSGDTQATPVACAPGSPTPLLLGAVLLAVFATCLINPHHFLVFPPAIEQAASWDPPWMKEAPSTGNQIDSGRIPEDPYASSHLLPSAAPANPMSLAAKLAYWSMVILGLLSFVLNRERWHWPRALLWLWFFFMTNYQSQAMPFFAVAGGIILALNVGEFLQANLAKPGWMTFFRRRVPIWQLCGTLGVLALVAAAWAGALQPGPSGPRSWRVDADPSLSQAAKQIAHWRRHGKVANGFLLSPELANYFAWFDPQQQGLVNSHVPSPDEHSASDYAAVRKALMGQNQTTDPDWRAILRRRDINYVVLYSNNQPRVELAVARLLMNRREWVPLFWQGRTLIFGWQDPAKRDQHFAAMALAPTKIAFSFDESTTAPPARPERSPESYRWWHAWGKAQDVRSPEVDEASMALTIFDTLERRDAPVRKERAWNEFYHASRTGLGGSIAMPHLVSLPLIGLAASKDMRMYHLFLENQDLGPRWAPYLAIRAARRAARDNPDNAFAYFLLGEAYYRLWSRTQEKAWIRNYGSFGRLRSIQMIAAYKQALHLKPDMENAHYRLAELFRTMNFKDVAVQHLQEYLKWAERRELEPGEATKVAEGKKILARQQKLIKRLREEYEVNSPNLKVVERARYADEKGLAGLALEILLQDDVSAFGTAGMDLELKLLLETGQVEKVRRWMDEEMEKVLPGNTYHWNKAQLHAALGDYQLADKHLTAMIMMPPLGDKKIPLRTAGGLIFGQGLLDTQESLFFQNPDRLLGGLGALPHGLDGIFRGRDGTLQGIMMVGEGLNGEANINVLRGLLALESGKVEQADAHFRKALDFWSSPMGRYFDNPESRYGRRIASQSRQMLAKVNRSR